MPDTWFWIVVVLLIVALVEVIRHGDGNDHEPPNLNTRGDE
jgi:hypothetical protein